MGEKSPRVSRINCKIKNNDAGSEHELFIGVWLMVKFKGNVDKIRSGLKNSWFQGLLRNDLRKFIKAGSTDIEAVEKHFDRSIGLYEGFRVRNTTYHGKIVRYPENFLNAVWFDNILQTKRNNSKNVENQLLGNFDSTKLISFDKSSKRITNTQ